MRCSKRPCEARCGRFVAAGALRCSACAPPATEGIDTARPDAGFRHGESRCALRAGDTGIAQMAAAARPTASRLAGTASVARSSSRIRVKKTCPPTYLRSRCATPQVPTIHPNRGAARRTPMSQLLAANRQSPLPRRTSSAPPTTEMPEMPLKSLLLRKNQAFPAVLAVGTVGGPAASRCRNYFVEPLDYLDLERATAHSIDGSLSAWVRPRALQRSSGRPLGRELRPSCEVTQ
jgi:hypothetical protein